MAIIVSWLTVAKAIVTTDNWVYAELAIGTGVEIAIGFLLIYCVERSWRKKGSMRLNKWLFHSC